MESQNHNSQSPVQPNKMADGVDNVLDLCLCAEVDFCLCTGAKECLCFDTKENESAPEGDAFEQSGDLEQFDLVENFILLDNTSVFEQYGVVQQSDSAGMSASHPIEIDDTTEESDAVEESISIAPEASITVRIKKTDATEEHIDVREHPAVGRYQLEPTSGEGRWCGAFALEISTASQLGRQMTWKHFEWLYNTAEMGWFNAQRGWRNTNLFYDEQLAKVLHMWGRYEGLGDLRLGVIMKGVEGAYILGENNISVVSSEADMEGERGFTTVWVHNDNAKAELGEAAISHYSGITLLGRGEGQSDGPEEEPDWAEDFNHEGS